VKRGDRVTVSGTLWQLPACETAIIQVDGGGLIAVPERAVQPELQIAEIPAEGISPDELEEFRRRLDSLMSGAPVRYRVITPGDEEQHGG
jgi:hypothetical protein